MSGAGVAPNWPAPGVYSPDMLARCASCGTALCDCTDAAWSGPPIPRDSAWQPEADIRMPGAACIRDTSIPPAEDTTAGSSGSAPDNAPRHGADPASSTRPASVAADREGAGSAPAAPSTGAAS